MNINDSIETIMTSDVRSVSSNDKIIEIKHIYEQPKFHAHIPVVDEGKVIGIVSLVNFMRAIHNASLSDTEEVYHEILVKDIMTHNPVHVSPATSIKEVASILSKDEFHSILVVEDSVLVGIVTTTDLLRELIK